MDNFDLKKYLAEGKLYEAINLDIEDDIAILSGDSGEYEGEIEDGKTSFSIIYDDLDYRISDQYNENNIEDFLGKGHAFVELAKKYDHKWGIERDLVGITIKLKDLAEGRLFEQERYRKVTDDDQGLDGVFYVEEDGYFVDLDYGKYKSATKELLDLAMEQGHEYESVENYYTYADNFENELKDYAEGEEVPDWQMNDLAVEYGTDYSQFYGEEEDEDDDEDVYENAIKEDKLVWTIEGDDDSPTIESSDKGYKEAVVSYIKSIHPNISDKNLKKSMEVAEETWYNEGRENAKSGEGEDFDVSVEEFADGAVEYYEDAYLEEGKLNENEDDSYYIDEIKRDLEELDDKEANEYLEDLAKAILKLKR